MLICPRWSPKVCPSVRPFVNRDFFKNFTKFFLLGLELKMRNWNFLQSATGYYTVELIVVQCTVSLINLSSFCTEIKQEDVAKFEKFKIFLQFLQILHFLFYKTSFANCKLLPKLVHSLIICFWQIKTSILTPVNKYQLTHYVYIGICRQF